jgi:hypothetical protein
MDMETVKVDVQKLQLLNDRIAQTIDALNQLRMSMHGIQHSPVSPGYPYGAYASPYGFGGQVQAGFGGQVPYGSPFLGSQVPGQSPYGSPFQGIQHTPYTPYTTPFTTPFTGLPTGTPAGTPVPFVGAGISHTAWDPRLGQNGISHSPWDQMWATRAAQTWSLVQPMPVPVTGA